MRVRLGRDSGILNSHGQRHFWEDVPPTTIQEHIVLRHCELAIGKRDAPATRLPADARDDLRDVARGERGALYAAAAWDARHTLAALGDSAVLDLLAVSNPEMDDIMVAANLPGPESTAALVSWLDTENVYVVGELARRGHQADRLLPIAERWLRDEPEDHAETAVRVIFRLAAPEHAIAALRPALRARKPGTRACAAAAIVALGDADTEALAVLARDLDEMRNYNAAKALLLLGDGGAAARPALPFLERRFAERNFAHNRMHLRAAITRIRTGN